jgi:hypothetical protein
MLNKLPRGEGVQVSVAIKYRHPRRPGEIGMILICDQLQAAEARESLKKRGFVILDDELPPRPQSDVQM